MTTIADKSIHRYPTLWDVMTKENATDQRRAGNIGMRKLKTTRLQ